MKNPLYTCRGGVEEATRKIALPRGYVVVVPLEACFLLECASGAEVFIVSLQAHPSGVYEIVCKVREHIFQLAEKLVLIPLLHYSQNIL